MASRKSRAVFIRAQEVARRVLANPPSAQMRPVLNPGPRYLGYLFHVQGGLCGICGLEMMDGREDDYCADHPCSPSIDHVVPRSRSGSLWFGNIVAAHKWCNQKKGNRLPTGCELIALEMVNTKLGSHFKALPAQGIETGTAETPQDTGSCG